MTQVFSSEICEIFKNTCFTEHLQWLFLTVSGFQRVTFLKKALRQRCFSVNFTKFEKHLLTECLRVTASCDYLWILRSFSEQPFYRAPPGNCLFHVQVAEFQPPDPVKNYFNSCFSSKYFTKKERDVAFQSLSFT